MKYGFTVANRKVSQEKQPVNCIETTSGHSWESPEGGRPLQPSIRLPAQKPHTLCEDLILPGPGGFGIEILDHKTAGEADTTELFTKELPGTRLVISIFQPLWGLIFNTYFVFQVNERKDPQCSVTARSHSRSQWEELGGRTPLLSSSTNWKRLPKSLWTRNTEQSVPNRNIFTLSHGLLY